MNDELIIKRLDTRATVLGTDTPSVESLAAVYLEFHMALGNKMDLEGPVLVVAYNRLVKEIMKHEHEAQQAGRMLLMCKKESKYYNDTAEKTQDEMFKTEEEINALKEKLQIARKHRVEKLEYERKCRIITKFPSRDRIQQRMNGLKQNTVSAGAETSVIDSKLEDIIKQSGIFFEAYRVLGHEFGLDDYILEQEDALSVNLVGHNISDSVCVTRKRRRGDFEVAEGFVEEKDASGSIIERIIQR
jgi:hypothetical protein